MVRDLRGWGQKKRIETSVTFRSIRKARGSRSLSLLLFLSFFSTISLSLSHFSLYSALLNIFGHDGPPRIFVSFAICNAYTGETKKAHLHRQKLIGRSLAKPKRNILQFSNCENFEFKRKEKKEWELKFRVLSSSNRVKEIENKSKAKKKFREW